jgi:phosphonate transport system substrate-binding protein
MKRLACLGLFGLLLAPALPVRADSVPLRLAVTDLEGLEQLQREFGAFREILVAKTGLSIDFFPVPNRTAAVEAMRSSKIDFVLTGPAEYVVFQNRTGAKPVVAFARPDYFADIIVLADGGIDSVKDLKGKKIALGDIGSTSKHLAPLQLLKDGGIDPLNDVERVHTSVKLGWEALKKGDVAALATTNDKYLSLRDKEKELPPGAFKVVARGRDLPNDVLLARPGVDPAAVEKVRQAILDNTDALVAAILKGEDNQKFKGMKFLLSVKDSDYDYIRAMYLTAGYPQFSKFPGE